MERKQHQTPTTAGPEMPATTGTNKDLSATRQNVFSAVGYKAKHFLTL
jgi:hypothetical protein